MKQASALTAVLAALAVTLDVEAAVYRCQKNGTVTYTDQPCANGSDATEIPATAPAASGSLDLQLVWTHYDVRGRDYASLSRSLAANGPRGFHGVASWRISYEYDKARSADVCRIEAVRVTVAGAILMPRWVNASSAPLALQRRWDEHVAALKRHEEGHIQHGRELALLIRERLLGLGAVTCGSLDALARSEYERLFRNLKTRDQEYDERTNHGATQGAMF